MTIEPNKLKKSAIDKKIAYEVLNCIGVCNENVTVDFSVERKYWHMASEYEDISSYLDEMAFETITVKLKIYDDNDSLLVNSEATVRGYADMEVLIKWLLKNNKPKKWTTKRIQATILSFKYVIKRKVYVIQNKMVRLFGLQKTKGQHLQNKGFDERFMPF